MNIFIAALVIFVGGMAILGLTTWWANRSKLKREAAVVLAKARREAGVYRIDHNLDDDEPLVSSYDAVNGALLDPMEMHVMSPMTVEVFTNYKRPFRVVVVNAEGAYRRFTFIPQEENP